MKTKALALAVMICLSCLADGARGQAEAPFARLDQQVRRQPGGWAGYKQTLATLFNAERRRLGGRFEEELLKYVARDVEKHYWASMFLAAPEYLQGHKPLPELSLYLKHQALALLGKREDEESLDRAAALGVTAAVLSARLGLGVLARAYKNEAERIFGERPALRAHLSALTEEEHKLYDSIPAMAGPRPPATFISERAENEPRAAVDGGILNNRAVARPEPAYPPEARSAGTSGEVKVKVVFDETGRVIWARAVNGPAALHAAALEAAYRATFRPVVVEGRAEKVSGFLVYHFAPPGAK